MGQLITIDNVLAGKKDIIDWLYIGYKKDGGTFPLKVWENLECVLQKHNIELRLNLINHEIDYLGLNGSQTRNGKMTDIYALQIKEGLGLSREETANSIMRIAEKYSYNPFVDMLKSNKNDDFAIIKDNKVACFIEYDGELHFEYKENRGWNNRENWERTHRNDEIKNQYAKDNGIPLIRIPYFDYDKLTIEYVKEKIKCTEHT